MRDVIETEGRAAIPGWQQEIEDLHAFFEDWIGGAVDPSDRNFSRLEEALGDPFTFVTTGGELLGREAIVTAIREAHGARPGLRIDIVDPRLLHSSDQHVVAVYEEWQEAGGEQAGRTSTAVLERSAASSNGLSWIHVHETWRRAD